MSRTVLSRLWSAAIVAFLASLFVMLPSQVVYADESMPDLQWPPADVNAYQYKQMTTSPQGDVTIGCDWLPSSSQDLITYDATGVVVREISQASQIDGNSHCIMEPVADEHGDIYGSVRSGTDLLAYDGDTLKWKYPFGCTVKPVVGADGNIYAVNSNSRLIGLSPELDAGQTQPTKVLDIPIGTGCNSEVQAFENGLAVSSASTLHYYGYDGADLGEPTGNYWQDRSFPINADGRLFFPVYVEGVSRSGKFSAYDPLTQEVAWTVQVSTPGASVSSFETLPVPGGGTAVIIRQQKMVSDNVPVTPSEYVYRLVVLSSNGVEKWSKELPNTDSDGNRYTSYPHSAVDTSGKIIVVRELRLQLSSSQVPAIEISTFDAITGDTIYHEEMRGNTDTASGPTYGYDFASATSELTIGPNTLYLNVMQCTTSSSCYYDDLLLHAVKVPGLGLDYPRGAVMSDSYRLPTYVALGDSFSSGEGNEPYQFGTAEPDVNECHRSAWAYAQVLNDELLLDLGAEGFRACSGAETQHIDDVGWQSENPQSEYLNGETDVVTLTIGGNDIGFGEFATACVLPGTNCNFNSSAYADAFYKINNELPAKLASTYELILQEAPNAEIYVLGYPHVAPEKTSADPMDLRCPFLYDSGYDSTGTIPMYWEDAQAARDVVMRINSHIESIIWDMREEGGDNLRLHYVEVNGIGSPFEGHEMCSSGDSYFQNLDQWPENRSAPFHPNQHGQTAYAELVAAAMLENAG